VNYLNLLRNKSIDVSKHVMVTNIARIISVDFLGFILSAASKTHNTTHNTPVAAFRKNDIFDMFIY
jgi:hypothetical protein